MLEIGVLKNFDSGTYKAGVQLAGSLTTYFDDISVAKNIPSSALVIGNYVIVAIPGGNPRDAVVIATWPQGSPGGAEVHGNEYHDPDFEEEGVAASLVETHRTTETHTQPQPPAEHGNEKHNPDFATEAALAAHAALTTGVHGAGANTLWHGGLTDIINKTHLSQDFGASSARLLNIIPSVKTKVALRIDNAVGPSPFSGLIDDNAGAHGGQGLDATHVPYDGDSNEDIFAGLRAYDGSDYWGQIVLHNTTRGNSRKIVSVDRTNNVITTSSSTDDWADNDVITCQSQTNTQAEFMDIDLSDKVAATDIMGNIYGIIYDHENNVDAGRGIQFHPYEAYDPAKTMVLPATQASQRTDTIFPMNLTGQKITLRIWSGCNDVLIVVFVQQTFEYADT